ncbi:MAG TPA: DNA alkylation repair protein [Candidatus Atribacteria bacterium]|nr:DNA alkylation repair protein [Candidatus Atribacteria bacterium]
MMKNIHEEFKKMSDQEHAIQLQKYFKTGKGEYGEGDQFLGLRVPTVRKIAKKFNTLSIDEAEKFLQSPYHEERLFALFILIDLFKKGNEEDKKKIHELYLKNTKFINNWDLVDVSAGPIIGAYLFTRDRKPIYTLANSENLWERRIAIMATFCFIAQNEFTDTLKIAEMLLTDKEDLIHKAVGWMLREIGKRNLEIEESFLKKYYQNMPRTMLRYAIEKFPEEKRKSYLKK